MGLFSNKELTEEQVAKINSLLPEKFQKSKWFESDFGSDAGIYTRVRNSIETYNNRLIDVGNKGLNELKQSKLEKIASKIKIFNTEPYKCEPLGMVDIGSIHRFSASSTGERFAGGLIGYAIESAADNMWTKGSSQEQAVDSVKLELLKKARTIYPECNLIFKYEVDFREMGSSGNVFIYMRGTACKGENEGVLTAEKQYLETLKKKEKELALLKEKRNKLKENLSKIPQSKKDIATLL